MKKIKLWKRRYWCARFHTLVKNKLCIYECGPPKYIDGMVVPGEEYSVWSMKCGRCKS